MMTLPLASDSSHGGRTISAPRATAFCMYISMINKQWVNLVETDGIINTESYITNTISVLLHMGSHLYHRHVRVVWLHHVWPTSVAWVKWGLKLESDLHFKVKGSSELLALRYSCQRHGRQHLGIQFQVLCMRWAQSQSERSRRKPLSTISVMPKHVCENRTTRIPAPVRIWAL